MTRNLYHQISGPTVAAIQKHKGDYYSSSANGAAQKIAYRDTASNGRKYTKGKVTFCQFQKKTKKETKNPECAGKRKVGVWTYSYEMKSSKPVDRAGAIREHRKAEVTRVEGRTMWIPARY